MVITDKEMEHMKIIEEMKVGFGKVRSEEEIQDDLDREFQEKMKREAERQEQERLYRERLAKEQEEIREAQYQKYKEIFDFMKVFNELEPDDFYCVVDLNDGNQYMAKPGNLKRDENFIMFYIRKEKKYHVSWGECPYYYEVEVNVDEVKGVKLVPEEKQEITIVKKSVYGVMKS